MSVNVAGDERPQGELQRRTGYERYVEPWWVQALRSYARGRNLVEPVPALARGWRSLAHPPRGRGRPLVLEHVDCNLCGRATEVTPIGVGEDFEYWTSPDSFLAVRCSLCGLIYLDPRPAATEVERIYPAEYHAFDFSKERFGVVYRARERLEARRLLRWAGPLDRRAQIVDVGCGDGFHLDLLRKFGTPTWSIEGVEPDARAAAVARKRGLTVHESTLDAATIDAGSVDLVLLIQTIEHVADPVALLSQIRRILRPGGRLVVVTDNVGSPDFRLFRSRHWGGWHFPRHWHLYDRKTLAGTATRAGLEAERIDTIVSPVNWVYSLRNLLVDLRAPERLSRPLSLEGPIALALGTVLDLAMVGLGRGALLRGSFRRPTTAVDL